MKRTILICFIFSTFLSACSPDTSKQQEPTRSLERSREDIRGLTGQTLSSERVQHMHPSYNSEIKGISVIPDKQTDW